MGWADLLSSSTDSLTLPWVGQNKLYGDGRTLQLKGKRPPEYGWHEFSVDGGRSAHWLREAEPDFSIGDSHQNLYGYLVGNRLITKGVLTDRPPAEILGWFPEVFLAENGLDRFAHVRVMWYEKRVYVFLGEDFGLGPEEDVRRAFEDREDISSIPGVSPALDLAYRLESFLRDEADKQRLEAEARRKREELQRAIGTGDGRRALAKIDYRAAVEAAFKVSGAELLDLRPGRIKTEYIINFRFMNQRFQCVADDRLQIVDSGICLVDHRTDIRGDTWFTLESLPAVIKDAIRLGKLVRFRHVD